MPDTRTLEIVSYAGVGALGACVGSFLNVVAYRLPRECMSVAKPRSRCPSCAAPIAWFDNIPVLSWLLLRGRCRSCRSRVSFRYPAIEAGVALLFVATAAMTLSDDALARPASAPGAWGLFALRALTGSVLTALALIDLDWQILPDQLTLGGLIAAPAMVFLAPSLQPGDCGFGGVSIGGTTAADLLGRGGAAALHGVVGAVAAGGFLWLVGFLGSLAFRKDAMGFGDVKMAAAMGALLGLWAFLAIGVAVVLGAVIGILVKLAGKGSYIRFGPFLAVGTWIVMMDGPRVLDLWLAFAGSTTALFR